MHRTDARAELWRRYDAGEATAEEVEARLQRLDRADDEAGLRSALDGPIPLHRRRAVRKLVLAGTGVLAVALLGAGAVAVAGGDGDGDGDDGATTGDGFATTVVVGGGAFAVVETFEGGAVGRAVAVAGTVPAPPPPPECLEEQERLVAGASEAPANPALLSDPAFAPEAYEHGDDDPVDPGADPDVAMAVAAGNPLPVEIAGRELDGHLPVRMRTFRYTDAAQATEAARASASSACAYDIGFFDVPDRAEISGFVVRGVIPTTAFASWQLGDRRFIVAVESDSDDEDDLDEARQLAAEIAGAELDAARTAPPPG